MSSKRVEWQNNSDPSPGSMQTSIGIERVKFYQRILATTLITFSAIIYVVSSISKCLIWPNIK